MAEDYKDRISTDPGDLLKRMQAIASDLWRDTPPAVLPVPKPPEKKPAKIVVKKPVIGIDNLWMTADETIEWTDALAHDWPADGLTSQELWDFYHKNAEEVLNGNISVYAEVLRMANPLGELMEFAQGISIRVPDADRLEASFNGKDEYLEKDRKKYLAAMGVRIARDLFACLPVSEVKVTASCQGKPAMTVTYRRSMLQHRNFSYLDPVMLTEECGADFTE